MQPFLRRLSVKSKLILLTLLTSSVALLLAAGIYTVYQLSVMRHELVRDVSALAQVVAEHGRLALTQEARQPVEQALRALRAEGLVTARVYAKDGRSVAGFGPGGPNGPDSSRPGLSEERIEGSHLVMYRPIVAGGESIGSVYVESDLADFYRRLTHQGIVAASVMLISFAIATLLSLRVQREIAQPIQDLAASAKQASDARLFDPPEVPARSDELGDLIHAFNGLVEGVQARERRYRALVENAADAVFLLDTSGRIVDVNRQACDDLGYAREELLSMSMAAIGFAGESSRATPVWQRVTPGDRLTLKGEHVRKNGSKYPVEVRFGCFQQGEHTHIMAISRDVSERERVARELERAKRAAESADRAKTRFLANVNHEIRTPMTSVIAMTELLERSSLGPEQTRYVEIARSSADSLLSVIDDILELSWTDSGRLALDSLDFDLPVLVDEVLELFAQRACSKGIELVARIDARVPQRLRGDPKHLRQVLINLLGNAVKFTEHGEVEISVDLESRDGPGVWLGFKVRDTGIGIPPSLSEYLFQPFAQQDSSSKRRHGGAGIGLAISRSLVEVMGGEIGVDSALDRGSIFWFTVRLDHGGEARDTGTVPQGLDGVRVLVVEHNEALRLAIDEQLARAGARVEAVQSRSGALERIALADAEGDRHRLVLLGLGVQRSRVEDQAAVELVHSIRAHRGHEDTRLVLMVPLGSSVGDDIASQAAIDAQLAKPVKQSRLVPFLASVLEQRSSPRRGAVEDGQQRRTPRAATPSPDGGRVLVVDDDQAIRTSMSLVLEVLGYSADAVCNGAEALEAFDREPYDAILMDCQMPEMDGCEATLAIREREAGRSRVPIVGMTGYVLEGERERCLSAGMDEHLSKPVSMAMLESVLASATSSRRMA